MSITTPTKDLYDPEQVARDAILVTSEMPQGQVECKGHDFKAFEETGKVDYEALLASFATTGFQAKSFAAAVEIIRAMRAWRLSDEPIRADEDDDLLTKEARDQVKCKVFLGFTSNMISCGVRESICFLARHSMVDVMVTTGGGIEEDIIKCLAPHLMGASFHEKGEPLRRRGINRIGNLYVPNASYIAFEEWFAPLLNKLHDEQEAAEKGTPPITPSELIHRLGKEINDERSVLYWCYKNNIRVYSPAITDGSIGDMISFHLVQRPGFVLDVARDVRLINGEAVYARSTGMVVLGGGLVKHHIFNANLMRNGADFTVVINTAADYDGSDAGANLEEAVSWGKVRIGSKSVKIHGEASFIFPLLVAQGFCCDPRA